MDTYLWIHFENLEGVFVNIVLTSFQRTPSFATVGQEDLRTGVGPVYTDEWEWNSRNLSVHRVPHRSDIFVWKKSVLVELACDRMNLFMMQIGGSEVCCVRQHSYTIAQLLSSDSASNTAANNQHFSGNLEDKYGLIYS